MNNTNSSESSEPQESIEARLKYYNLFYYYMNRDKGLDSSNDSHSDQEQQED